MEKMNTMKTPVPSEGYEQATLFHWAKMVEYKYPELRMMFHIPNGGSRGKAEAARFKAEGVKAGVSDIFLSVPSGSYHGLYIEMKRQRGGRVSQEQKDFQTDASEYGYKCCVCHGWEEAKNEIINYIESGRVKYEP